MVNTINYIDKAFNFSGLEDHFIYLAISLESLLSEPDENTEIIYRYRLRSSLYLQKIDNLDPRFVQEVNKNFYNIRSRIVHGSSHSDKIESIKTKKINGIKISGRSLIVIAYDLIRQMLCDAKLNHSEDSKEEFINFIDSIWKNKEHHIKWDLEEIRDFWDKM